MSLTRREFVAILQGLPGLSTWRPSPHTGDSASLPMRADQVLRPNLILILADDLGFSDIGCYGSEIETPNLDRLASQGLRFTQFYNCGRCCPSRASVLTGLYPHQTGIGYMNGNQAMPGYTGDLNDRCLTIAEALGVAGYQTWISGKWHVTPVNSSRHNWPLQRGFDRFYGTIHGAGSYYDPVTLARDNDYTQPEGSDFYYTDAITENACRFLEEGKSGAPFFLYLSYTAPHWPLHARPEDIARYRDRYLAGWDDLRTRRYQRQIEMGLLEPGWPLSQREPGVPAWQEVKDREWQAIRMAVYGAQVESMDRGIGRIISCLQKSGRLNDTLILFASDNGGCAEEMNPRLRGIHVPEQTRQGRSVRFGNDPSIIPGPEDTYASYGVPWANLSNTPFRLFKQYVHEGGIASPLIAYWPSGITSRGGFCHQAAHLIDILPTCLALARARYPTEFRGRLVLPMEGRSLVPALQGKAPEPRILCWEHRGNRAVLKDHRKLVSRAGTRGPEKWELYDLRADRTELRDQAGARPLEVARLEQLYKRWARRCGVMPWDTVNDRPVQSCESS